MTALSPIAPQYSAPSAAERQTRGLFRHTGDDVGCTSKLQAAVQSSCGVGRPFYCNAM